MTAQGRLHPVLDLVSAEFWRGTVQERLLVQRNPRTGTYQWYPRGRCLDDPDAVPQWVPASGRAEVWSYSAVYRSPNKAVPTPFVVALLRLEEGLLMTATLVDVEPEEVHIGMRVSVRFEELSAEARLPVFAPDGRS